MKLVLSNYSHDSLDLAVVAWLLRERIYSRVVIPVFGIEDVTGISISTFDVLEVYDQICDRSYEAMYTAFGYVMKDHVDSVINMDRLDRDSVWSQNNHLGDMARAVQQKYVDFHFYGFTANQHVLIDGEYFLIYMKDQFGDGAKHDLVVVTDPVIIYSYNEDDSTVRVDILEDNEEVKEEGLEALLHELKRLAKEVNSSTTNEAVERKFNSLIAEVQRLKKSKTEE